MKLLLSTKTHQKIVSFNIIGQMSKKEERLKGISFKTLADMRDEYQEKNP